MSSTRRLQTFPPEDLTFNEAIAARSGEPSKAKIERLANNMLERREAGQPHQIQPGVVRSLPDGTVEVIVGRHRALAEQKLNDNLPEGEEQFLFEAVVIPPNVASDINSLLDAVDENEFRTATSARDRADAMAKLVALGKSQKEVAEHLGLKPSTVSDYLKLRELPKKILDRIDKGSLTEEAAIKLARYNGDPKYLEDMEKLSDQMREAREAVEERAEARLQKLEGGSSDEEEPAKGGKKKSTGTGTKGRTTPKGRTTAQDVRRAAEAKGVAPKKKKAGNGDDGHSRSMRDLLVLLQANFGPKVEEDIPTSYREFARAIEEWRDRDLTDLQFLNRWRKYVVAAAKANAAD